jgi:hypothetical protein
MTKSVGDKLQHNTTHKVGTIIDVVIKQVCDTRLRYVKVKWDNEAKDDDNYYLSKDLREIKSLESLLKKNASKNVKYKGARTKRQLLVHNTKLVRFLQPEIQNSDLNKVLTENSGNLLSNPPTEFILNRQIADHSNGLKPGQSIVPDRNETEWVDMDSTEADISDSEDTEDTDRSKRNINIDAVNYQVSNGGRVSWVAK